MGIADQLLGNSGQQADWLLVSTVYHMLISMLWCENLNITQVDQLHNMP